MKEQGPMKPGQPEGRALVVFAHGEGIAVVWDGNDHVQEWVSDAGADHGDGFKFEQVDHPPLIDGVWIGELKMIDDGPSDWSEQHRECVLSFINARPATKEEWKAHLDEEWPWEPMR